MSPFVYFADLGTNRAEMCNFLDTKLSPEWNFDLASRNHLGIMCMQRERPIGDAWLWKSVCPNEKRPRSCTELQNLVHSWTARR